LIERLLEQLRRQTCAIAEILVVDNGSRDGSVELAREKGVRVIALERNLGFSGAVNRGIQETRTEYVAIVNNDVEPEPDWLERLRRALAEPRVFFATGKLLQAAEPHLLDGTFDTISRGACAWRAGSARSDGALWSERRRIRLTPFTAALFRTELFRHVGHLDESFGSYLEDVDFGLRCALRGYLGMYVPEAVARHAGSATLGRWHRETVRLNARNQVLLVAKHYAKRHLVRYAWSILVGQSLWGFVALRHGHGFSWLRGKLEGLALFPRVRRRAARAGGRRTGLSKILEQSEFEIYQLQKQAGFDPYWRVYFALTCLA
jgi:GT2 family glycosyltransferase